MDDKPWVLYTNMRLSHEQFTEIMRGCTNHPKILHWGGAVMVLGVEMIARYN